MAEVEGMVPMRIGAICRNAILPYSGSQPGQPPHALANSRFMALIYMPVGKGKLPAPFNGGVHDPPVETEMIQILNPVAIRFLGILHYN